MGHLTYKIVLGLIHSYKWIELQFIRLFLNTIIKEWEKLAGSVGITLNGSKPWDPQIHTKEVYARVSNWGGQGLGSSYVDGQWDCKDLYEFTRRSLRSNIYKSYFSPWNWMLNKLHCYYFNEQTKDKSFEVGEQHYDLGNDLYKAMLDPYMQYTCGYWRTAKNIDQAQLDKMDMIAKKLMLKKGMKVLDIGCGFGGLAKFFAEKYEVSVLGVTVSKEQVAFGKELCKGLPVEIKLMDYRDLPKHEKYDRIACIGMFEHVGPSNYDEFYETTRALLKDDGLMLVHCIGVNHFDFPQSGPWISALFPNVVLPYYKQICDGIEKRFIIEDWHNMGFDYYKTLVAWEEKFDKAWPSLRAQYGERFYRMWKYYLGSCGGAFASRKIQLWQVVLSKEGYEGGYYAAR